MVTAVTTTEQLAMGCFVTATTRGVSSKWTVFSLESL
jgi:hypothetical protein